MQRNLDQIEGIGCNGRASDAIPVRSFLIISLIVVLFLLQLEGRLRAALALRIWKNSPNSIWTISTANDASQLNLIYRIYP